MLLSVDPIYFSKNHKKEKKVDYDFSSRNENLQNTF